MYNIQRNNMLVINDNTSVGYDTHSVERASMLHKCDILPHILTC